ncbi:MAG: hypothetical protein JWN37_480 [Candidatus Nomurabacteria bacterium]|nr:hypothetical protein [Candidatus Nomurabacteria bacterium]
METEDILREMQKCSNRYIVILRAFRNHLTSTGIRIGTPGRVKANITRHYRLYTDLYQFKEEKAKEIIGQIIREDQEFVDAFFRRQDWSYKDMQPELEKRIRRE